jgi:predicted DCC family thiol-disulfide oxidoreductase YuxK
VTQQLELMFDGDCGICRACVRWLERHDRDQHIQCTASSECAWSDAASLPFARSVVVRDGRGTTYLFSTAVAKALSALPGRWGILGKWVLLVNRFPPFRSFNDFQYRLVSRNRRTISNVLVRLGLLDSSCRIPTPKKF